MPTSGTPRPHKVHVVTAGETIDQIAAKHYGHGGDWRSIAEANHLSPAFALTVGQRLVIPPVEPGTE